MSLSNSQISKTTTEKIEAVRHHLELGLAARRHNHVTAAVLCELDQRVANAGAACVEKHAVA